MPFCWSSAGALCAQILPCELHLRPQHCSKCVFAEGANVTLVIDLSIVLSVCLRMVPMLLWLYTALSLPPSSSCLPLSFITPLSSQCWRCMLPSKSVSSWPFSLIVWVLCLSYPCSGCHWLQPCPPDDLLFRCLWHLHGWTVYSC